MTLIPFSSALLASCLIGILSAYIAHRQGRNPYAWFFIGIFFGLLGVLAIFIAPKKPKKITLTPQPHPVIIGPLDKLWYYLDPTHEKIGPMSFQALNTQWKQGKITPATYVWHEELPDWKLLQDFIQVHEM